MKKRYIIIFTLLIVYFGLAFIIYKDDINTEPNKDQLFITNDVKLIFNDSKIKNLSTDDIPNNTKFYVYDNYKYKGKYYIRFFKDNIYLFDDNNNSISLDGDFVGLSSKNKIKLKDYDLINIEDVSSNKYIKKIEKEYNVAIDNQNSNNRKLSLDFDADNELEDLYFISNMYNVSENENGYSFVYYVDDGKMDVILDNVVKRNEKLDAYDYHISNIIDYNNDNKYEIIIANDKFRPQAICYSVFELKDGKFVPIKSC